MKLSIGVLVFLQLLVRLRYLLSLHLYSFHRLINQIVTFAHDLLTHCEVSQVVWVAGKELELDLAKMKPKIT